MPDWEKLKAEYITDTAATYRSLGEKYGVNFASIGRRASREHWPQEREKSQSRINARCIRDIEKKKAAREARLITASDKAMNKILSRLDQMSEEDTDGRELRQLVAAMKDIRDIQLLRSDLDVEEQRTRIEVLKKQAQTAPEGENEVRIIDDV